MLLIVCMLSFGIISSVLLLQAVRYVSFCFVPVNTKVNNDYKCILFQESQSKCNFAMTFYLIVSSGSVYGLWDGDLMVIAYCLLNFYFFIVVKSLKLRFREYESLSCRVDVTRGYEVSCA